MKRIIPLLIIIVAAFSANAQAQLEIGASYELREESPQNGFGLRIEKGILQKLPIVDLSLRIHGSYFSEENSLDISSGGTTYSYSQDLSSYDIGVAAIGGASLGLLQPYVGVGIGTENYDLVAENFTGPESLDPAADESSLYWNVLVGAKVTVLPLVKPFIEYRYSAAELEKPELQDVDSSTGRIMFGVSLSF